MRRQRQAVFASSSKKIVCVGKKGSCAVKDKNFCAPKRKTYQRTSRKIFVRRRRKNLPNVVNGKIVWRQSQDALLAVKRNGDRLCRNECGAKTRKQFRCLHGTVVGAYARMREGDASANFALFRWGYRSMRCKRYWKQMADEISWFCDADTI